MELAYEREGSGPPLVLLAGIGMNATAWQPVRSRLAAERELTLIDLPGFGNSAALSDGTDSTIHALTQAVERCRHALDVAGLDDCSGAVPAYGLAEPADVVDDRR